ncbi:MAG: helix-turn-helix transcriptional regulator [Bifidobacterium sp.]|nr:helix-turn-helix transcriptional regulator [Bifidobacterium sp.]
MARPRSFDEQLVLEQCREVFCTHGYDATSIDDLVAATELKRGSLYQAFGSKRGVFLKVLQGTLNATIGSKSANRPESRENSSIAADKPESQEGRSVPAETTSPANQTPPHQKTTRPESTFFENDPFPNNVLTLAAIACLELAPHDAKVRDIIAQWRSLIPPEQAALLPQALGDNLLNRAGIATKPMTD